MTLATLARLAGPAALGMFLLLPAPQGLAQPAWYMLGVTAWMALWWISEAVPIPATALLPIVLFPPLGILPAAEATQAYANHLIYLFMGGFMIAVAMERWQLHHRLALHVIRAVGTGPARLVLGFMLATALLSMWISNTATAMLMVTIGMAVLRQLLPDDAHLSSPLGTALMLGIAYAASIGGVATLIGTPPNAVLAAVLDRNYGIDLQFATWMRFALPLAVLMLVVTWLYLTRVAFPVRDVQCRESAQQIHDQLQALGRASAAEMRVALVFGGVALLWIFRGLIDWAPLQAVRDSTIAIAGALLLFVLPAGDAQNSRLLDWQTAVRIPWDIIILFGGGLSLAAGFSETGLTAWLGEQLRVLEGAPLPLLILGTGALVIFLTEVTSNTATDALMLPVVGALSQGLQVSPLLLMVTATLCASFAFMLPVATPPNAIVFGSRCVHMGQMARAGLWLNIIGVLLISLFVYLWGVVLPPSWSLFSL